VAAARGPTSTLRRQREQQALLEANAERLRSQLQDWRTAQGARLYATALRELGAASALHTGHDLSEWVEWIERWANEIDPASDTSRLEGLMSSPSRASRGASEVDQAAREAAELRDNDALSVATSLSRHSVVRHDYEAYEYIDSTPWTLPTKWVNSRLTPRRPAPARSAAA
jgi:hypothetical protein